MRKRGIFNHEIGVNFQIATEHFGWHNLTHISINHLFPRISWPWDNESEVKLKLFDDLSTHRHDLLDREIMHCFLGEESNLSSNSRTRQHLFRELTLLLVVCRQIPIVFFPEDCTLLSVFHFHRNNFELFQLHIVQFGGIGNWYLFRLFGIWSLNHSVIFNYFSLYYLNNF